METATAPIRWRRCIYETADLSNIYNLWLEQTSGLSNHTKTMSESEEKKENYDVFR